jgi:hypothetical protein
MPEPRRHHLLPQFYMRSFANARGQVRVVERATGREFTTSTANVFVERDYYTVSSVYAEDDHQLIEGLYAQVEGVAAPIFEQLRDGNSLSAARNAPSSLHSCRCRSPAAGSTGR